MRSKIEFEARVRELAEIKKAKERRKRRTIRNLTITGGGILCAACCALVFTKMNGLIEERYDKGVEIDMMNSVDTEMLPENQTRAENSISDGEYIGNFGEDNVIMQETNADDSIQKEDAMEYGCLNGLPDKVIMTSYPGGFTENTNNIVLTEADVKSLIEWISSLELQDTGLWDNENNGLLYEFVLEYQNENITVLVSDDMVKINNDTWHKISSENAVDFENLIGDFY